MCQYCVEEPITFCCCYQNTKNVNYTSTKKCHWRKCLMLVILFFYVYLSGRRGSRKRLQTSSTSQTLKGTMLRLPLFTWTGEFCHSCDYFFVCDSSVSSLNTNHPPHSPVQEKALQVTAEVCPNGVKLRKSEWD